MATPDVFSWPNLLGVVNVTPDSFSDGGEAYSSQSLRHKLTFLRQYGISFFDIGAESTAPFNSALDERSEWKRLERAFFPNLNFFRPEDVLSLDTYRVSTHRRACQELSWWASNGKLVFNDVSGCLDQELAEHLAAWPAVPYVYCHNQHQRRQQGSSHMHYPTPGRPGELVDYLVEYFKRGEDFFTRHELQNPLIFDPCFGFSKTYEQNLELLRALPGLVSRFSSSRPWLVGISRKSFMRKRAAELLGEGPSDVLGELDLMGASEYLHAFLLRHWQQELGEYKIIYRVHDPILGQMALKCRTM